MLLQGSLMFPEFSWILENPSVVRAGKNLAPGEDYIDSMTKSVTLLMSFFTTTSQVLQPLHSNTIASSIISAFSFIITLTP